MKNSFFFFYVIRDFARNRDFSWGAGSSVHKGLHPVFFVIAQIDPLSLRSVAGRETRACDDHFRPSGNFFSFSHNF